MDCTVHGVTKSWTGLSDFHIHMRGIYHYSFAVSILSCNSPFCSCMGHALLPPFPIHCTTETHSKKSISIALRQIWSPDKFLQNVSMDILYSVLFMKSEGAIKFLTSGKQAIILSVLSSPQKLFKNLSLILHKAREPVCLCFHINIRLYLWPTLLTPLMHSTYTTMLLPQWPLRYCWTQGHLHLRTFLPWIFRAKVPPPSRAR